MSRILGALAVFACFALAACPQPSPRDGALACSKAGACPKGYACSNGFCFGTSGSADLAEHDQGAAVDLAGVDLASRDVQCEEYCTCMVMNCAANNAVFSGATECTTYCAGLPAGAQMDCRIIHCGLAKSQNNAALHCPHALGIGMCADQ